MSAMKFLAQQEKNSKFQNKRYQELEKLVNSPHHTRSNIRIKFADGYILQGTFGAKETIKDVYDFVAENLFYTPDERQFYLYETPPKRILDDKVMKQTLIQAKLVPSCMLYHGWKDLSETKPDSGPFLKMNELKNKIL